MRLHPAGISPRVRALPAAFRRDVGLELGSLTLEMSTAEALDLADRLVDAAEKSKSSVATVGLRPTTAGE